MATLVHVRAQGMLQGVLDCSWTCDSSRVLGAGHDQSIRIWEPASGRVRHTMTGHSGKVNNSDSQPFILLFF